MYKVFLFNKALVFLSTQELNAFSEDVPYFHYSDQADLLQRYRALVQDGNERKNLYVVDPDPFRVWRIFASGFENVLAAGGLVKDPEGRMLFILRHNRWDLPKGKVEEGEDLAEAAQREVEEECGIRVDRVESHLMDSYHIYQAQGVEFLKRTSWFRMRVDDPQDPVPQTAEGISKVEWRSPDELEEVKRSTFASILEVMEVGDPSAPVQ